MARRQPRMISEDDWLEGYAREARGDLAFDDDEPSPGIPEVMPEAVADMMTADVAKRLPELQALQTQLAQLHTPALDDVAREGAARLAEDNKALIANAQEPQAKALSAESTLATRPPPAALTEQQVEQPAMSPPPAAAAVKEEAEARKGPPPIVEQAKGLEQKAATPSAQAQAAEPQTTEQQMAALQTQIAQMLSADSEPQAQPEAYAAPPRKKTGVLDDEGAMWAALLDVFVNRGRGTPQILQRAGELADKRRNDQLDEDYRVAQINSLNRRGIVDPETKQLQKIRLMQAAARLQMQAEHDKLTAGEYQRRMDETKAKYGAGSPQVQQVISEFKGLGVPDRTLAAVSGMSMDTVKSIMPTLRQQADIAQSPQLAQAAADTAAATEAAKADVRYAYRGKIADTAAERIGAEDRARLAAAEQLAEARSRGTQVGKGDMGERRFAAEQIRNFNKDYGKEMDIVGLMSSIDANGGAIPQSIAERIATDQNIAGYGIDPKRLDVVSAKRLILEIWGRDQSGAAIAQSEIRNFKNQVADMSWADDRQIESAYRTMYGMLQQRLQAGSLGNAWAPELLAIHMRDGDPWAFLGRTREEQSALAKPPAGQSFSGRPTGEPGAGEPPQVAPQGVPMPVTDTRQTATAQPEFDPTAATPTLRTQSKVPKAPIKRGPAQPPPTAAPAPPAAAAAKQPYTITYPSGRSETLPLTPEEAATVGKKYKVTPGAAPAPGPQPLQLEY